MPHLLLIAEKPDLMRKIQAVYQKISNTLSYTCDFTAQAGHLVTLKLPKEIDKEKYGKWVIDAFPQMYPYKYKVIPEKKDMYERIDSAIKSGKYDGIIHAGDPDQEGELLIRLVLGMSKNTLPVYRFWTNDLSEESIKKALMSLKNDKEYDSLFQAALIRQRSDYQFGFNLTGVVTVKMGGELCRLGRVKAPIIYILAKREAEIRNYVEKITYKPAFRYKDCEFIYDKQFDTKEQAEAQNPMTDRAVVTDFKSENKNTKPPKLFKLSTLQVASFKELKMSGSDTLATLQTLYEQRLVSYPRTDCEFISTETDIEGIKNKVVGILSFDTSLLKRASADVLKDKNFCNDKAISTEGHTAIIPTGEKPGNLTKQQQDLYLLICKQYLAMFGENKVTKHNTVTASPQGSTNEYVFKEKEDLIVGFELILKSDYEVAKASGINWQQGMVLSPIELFAKECVSKPPKRFNNGSLIKLLDNPEQYENEEGTKIKYSIGTPATRSGIIEQCLVTKNNPGGYIEEKKGAYYATPKAEALVENFESIPIFQPIESGKWENYLIRVRNREVDPKKVQDSLLREMLESIERIKQLQVTPLQSSSGSQTKVLGTCPHCKAEVVTGKFGPYCKNKCGMFVAKAMGKELTEAQISSLLQNKRTLVKGLKSNKGSTYDAYLTPSGISEFTYTKSDGTKATGYGWTFSMEFPQKGDKKKTG